MKNIRILSGLALLVLSMGVAHAVQPESPVACNEGNEPLSLSYGDHTTGCRTDSVTDLDRFSFVGSIGDNVRINIASIWDGSDPQVEVRDPGGAVIADQSCTGGCSFSIDLSLTDPGTYFVSVEERDLNETGIYQVNLQCLFGPCPPNFARALIDVMPTSGLETTELGNQATFEVVLNGAPFADVTIDLSSSEPSEGTVVEPVSKSLTFTPADWDIPQIVTVSGEDDPFADGPQQYKIITAAAVSGDPIFNAKDPQDVSIINLDDEGACINLDIDVDGNGSAEPLTDGLLIIRYLFGLRGDALIAGAVGSGCTRCTAAAIEAYLAGLIP